ncbi:MAG: hypothetical protein J6D03_07685 [Clostridia bacterium]|nr:hypothetical protein [Clostridia bacterium]MBO5530554.1 hypothetical protein [Bacilli bacterium]
MKDNIQLKFKTLEKLIKSGYNTDEKIKNMKLDDVWKIKDISSSDLQNIKGLIEAIKTKKLIAFFSGIEISKEGK